MAELAIVAAAADADIAAKAAIGGHGFHADGPPAIIDVAGQSHDHTCLRCAMPRKACTVSVLGRAGTRLIQVNPPGFAAGDARRLAKVEQRQAT
ncbi:hypothetical protein J8I87_02655 [Paraburkholderia sp. LEh10]|uniref:hypothetical protein n=1 Tax=Paraburkholderia sp. LEh10 TaxID=2821353 RepID=UPI001AE4105D|nr:hypothetical protein [Paraburkholderia sp. LEh10]MBP0588634.1 hypothetical protein [Paraburkholderia sp. LEh10]